MITTRQFYKTFAYDASGNKRYLVNTFLPLLGIGLAVKLAINPIENLWLLEKLIAIVFYIFTGYYTLKLARNRAIQVIGCLGAMGCVSGKNCYG